MFRICFLLLFLCLGALEAAHFENLVNVVIKVEDLSYNLKVKSLKFNGEEVKLDDPDMFKPRRTVEMKLPPGRYLMAWSTEKVLPKWSEDPVKHHDRIVVIESGDSTVRINVKGDGVTLF